MYGCTGPPEVVQEALADLKNMPWSLPSTHCLCWVWPHMGSHIVFVLCKRDWSNANCRKVLSNKMFVITCRKTPRLPACLLRSGSTSQLEGPPPAMFKYCNKYFYVRMTAIVIFAIFASFNHYHVAWLTWEIIWVFGVDEKKEGLEICLFSNIKTLLAHA